MAYGRLDVFWPDGKFESFLLNTTSVSVGRSSGCTVVLDTETISRYHFSITHENGQVTINDMDSANGTFVDGMRLKNNESRVLHGGEELQVGHLRMIYHRLDEQATVPIGEVSEDTQRFVKEDFGFSVEVYGPEIAVPPGSHTSIEISIQNRLPEPRRFTIKVTGLPEGWARVNRPQVVIDPDDGAPVLVNVKPLRQSDSKPGEYPVKIEVALKDEPEKKIVADISVIILPYTGFGMALAARKITAYESFRLHVHNQGSIGLPIFVMGRSKDDSLRFAIADAQIVLMPGERYVIQGDVKPRRRRLFGAAREMPFDVMVRSRDEAAFLAAIRGYYLDQPILPTWAAALLGGVTVLVFGVLLASLVVLLQSSEPVPQITAFQANATQIARGEPLTLSWASANAERLTLQVGEDNVVEIPADSSSYTLDTTAYSGQVALTLRGANDDQTAEQSLVVVVYEPLTVEYFVVSPEFLVRNVVQEVNVRWHVNQATATRVAGLDSLGPIVIEPSYGPQGDFIVSGIPTNDFAVTLQAEDAYGNTLERVIEVNLMNPECATTSADFTLYAQPDVASNVISTLPQGTVLVVDGRDETGAWLRTTQVSGGVEAWGARSGLVCSDIFNPDALQIRIPERIETMTVPAPTPTSSN